MNVVIQNLGNFMLYAIIAMFVENAVFSRALGVSRLVNLVTETPVDSLIFCSLLTLVQVISAPLAYFANHQIAASSVWFRDYIRPLILVLCAIAAFIVVLAIVLVFRLPNHKNIITALPMAAFNTAVLGPMLIGASQNFGFVQTMGFAIGSGLGYGFAVLIVTEGQRKMNSRNVPSTFRGLPINLIYIGILALAIYGLTGHRLVI